MNKKLEKIVQGVSGAAIGFVNGFFGGGGGMLCVPLLEKLFKLETKKAHATAILIILPISIASAITYIVSGYFSFYSTSITSIGVVTGGIIGALLLKKLNPNVVGIIFAIIMIAAGMKLALLP